MAFEVVKQIIDVEKEGEELIKKANSKSQEIIKSAREEANSIINEAKKESENYYNVLMSQYEGEAIEESKPIIEQSEVVNTQLKNIPLDLLDRAVNMVIERIVNSHGDS